MPQSAIKIPQGQTGILTIKEPVRIYCRTNGSDTNGDGTITNPFFSVHKAIRYLEQFAFIEDGRATIDVGPGRFDFSTPIVVNDQSGKIAIAGVCPSFFTLRQVSSYNYADGSDGNAATNIQNYMTLKLVKPEDPETLSVSGINAGDWLLIENATYQKANPYTPSQHTSYGTTGGNPDKSVAALGCFEVYSVDETNQTVTVKHRAKNHVLTCHALDRGAAASGSFSSGTNTYTIDVDDPIYIGGPGFDTVGEQAAFDDFNPEGFYGSDAISGTGAQPVLISDEIRVKVIKTVLKWKPSFPSVSGMILNENASLDGIENIIFAGGDCTKYYHELNPIHCSPAIKLSGNSSIRKYAVAVDNLGFSGWFAAIVCKNGSSFSGDNIVISNVGDGIAAVANSNIFAKYLTITGADVNAIRCSSSSYIESKGAIIGLGGYNIEAAPVVASTNLPAISSGWTTINVDGELKKFRIVHNPSYRYLPETYETANTYRYELFVYGLFESDNGGHYPNDNVIVAPNTDTYGVGESINCPAERI